MSINSFLGLATFAKLVGPSDDDLVDRMSHLYSVLLLVLFAVVSSGGQFVDNPIDCMMPGNFFGSYVSYAKTYCWIMNTYYIPLDQSIPQDVGARQEAEVTYYQWVPLMLLLMALLFKLPCVVWRVLTKSYTVNVDKLTSLVMSLDVGHPMKRQEGIVLIAQYLDRWLRNRRQYRNNLVFRFRRGAFPALGLLGGKRDGSYLTGLYVLVKLFYVVNVVGQFFALNAFMGGWFGLYGVEVLQGLLGNAEWRESHRFPRVTLCDFELRQLENVQRYTVQCVMSINMFNEKIFLILWFWMLLVGLASLGSFLLWLYRLAFADNRVAYVRKHLDVLGEPKEDEDKERAVTFCRDYMRDDGVFVLRMVARNCNPVLLGEMVHVLWKMYVARDKHEAAKAKAEAEGKDKEKDKSEADDDGKASSSSSSSSEGKSSKSESEVAASKGESEGKSEAESSKKSKMEEELPTALAGRAEALLDSNV